MVWIKETKKTKTKRSAVVPCAYSLRRYVLQLKICQEGRSHKCSYYNFLKNRKNASRVTCVLFCFVGRRVKIREIKTRGN